MGARDGLNAVHLYETKPLDQRLYLGSACGAGRRFDQGVTVQKKTTRGPVVEVKRVHPIPPVVAVI